MEKKTENTSIPDELEMAFDLDIPHIYCNGFSNILTLADVILLLKIHGKSVATLNMSFTLAKTLSIKLGEMIKILENKTGNVIMVTEEINKSLIEGVKDDNK